MGDLIQATRDYLNKIWFELRRVKEQVISAESSLNDSINDCRDVIVYTNNVNSRMLDNTIHSVASASQAVHTTLIDIKDAALTRSYVRHVLIENESITLHDLKSLSFRVISGSVDVNLLGNTITYPIDNIDGMSYQDFPIISNSITFTATAGKVLIAYISTNEPIK